MFYRARETHSGARRSRPRPPWERERRLVVRSLAVGTVLAAMMTSGVLGSQRGGGTWVTVQPGQTLWAIATAHYPQTDPRQSVYDIQAANHLRTANIYPGERLLLPTE